MQFCMAPFVVRKCTYFFFRTQQTYRTWRTPFSVWPQPYFIAHGLLDQTRWTVPATRIGVEDIWKAGNVRILNLHISKKIFGITVREWNDVFVALMESETCLIMIYWQARIISLENQLYVSNLNSPITLRLRDVNEKPFWRETHSTQITHVSNNHVTQIRGCACCARSVCHTVWKEGK
jgi:hypothetical protein